MASVEQKSCPYCAVYEAEIDRLRKIIEGFADRVAGQSEVISKFAERSQAPKVDQMITFPPEKP